MGLKFDERRKYKLQLVPNTMKFIISDRALEFLKDMQPENKSIRIRGKVYGSTNIHAGLSVALETGIPEDPSITYEDDDLLVYTERDDDWFFAGHDLEIDYDEDNETTTYYFVEPTA